MSSSRLERMAEAIDREIQEGRLPGAVLAIARSGRLVYCKAHGYRDFENDVALTEDDLFWAASMTKPVAAVGALTLYEEGRLQLADPLSRHLPQFGDVRVADLEAGALKTVDPVREPTIQDLMRHTSGIVEGLLGSTEVHRLYVDAVGDGMTDLTGEEFAERLSRVPLLHQPGAVWHYGWGFDLLGLIVQSITGQRLSEFLKARVFEPLGMSDSTFGLPGEVDRYARPLPKDPWTGNPQQLPDLSRARFDSGGAGIVTTARDYLRFAVMLAGETGIHQSGLPGRKTIELMMSDHLGCDVDDHRIAVQEPTLAGYGFGLGVAVRRHHGLSPAAGTPGDVTWPGASGAYWWADSEEELAVVFMAHTPSRPARRYYRQLVRALVLQAIVE